MKIGIIGLGVVGAANKSGFKKLNHKVYIHDIKKNTKINNLIKTEIIYICVPTPSNKNGSCNTKYVENVIFQLTKNNYKGIMAIRSTVEPGFTNNMIRKSANDPRFSSPQFIKLRNEIGNSKVKNQILKPAYKAYCDCLGTSIYSGDTISEATKTCGTYLKYEFKKGLSKFGYF